jgi:hypothetical protein
MLLYYTKLQVSRKWCLAISTPPNPVRATNRPIWSMVSLSKTPLILSIVTFSAAYHSWDIMINTRFYGFYLFYVIVSPKLVSFI